MIRLYVLRFPDFPDPIDLGMGFRQSILLLGMAGFDGMVLYGAKELSRRKASPEIDFRAKTVGKLQGSQPSHL